MVYYPQSQPVLAVTDGITRVSFITPKETGFTLKDNGWRPQSPDYKGGGIFNESPLVDGRQPVAAFYENVIDSFDFVGAGKNQDIAIEMLQDLRRLLVKALQFWTSDYADEPVWIEAKAAGETNLRYAAIYISRVPEDTNPYGDPFKDCPAVMQDLTLIIEHMPWQDVQPGTATAIPISAVAGYDGLNYGNIDGTNTRVPTTTDGAVFVANKSNIANITDVYTYDDSTGLFSANLQTAALPITLFPLAPAVDDAVYFGIDTTLVNSGPFASLVFDIGTAQNNLTITWENWNGAAWVTLTATDRTKILAAAQSFTRQGVYSFHFEQPATWASTTVNGITGMWIRARLTAVGGAPVNPTQINRRIYTVTWPYTDVQLSAIGGDLPALARMVVKNASDRDGRAGLSPERYSDRVLVGLRSLSRGEDFVSYINIVDEQNPSSITVSRIGGDTADLADMTAPAGRVFAYVSPGSQPTLTERFTIVIGTSVSAQYYGRYRMFIRVNQLSGVSGALTLKVIISFGFGTIYESAVVYPAAIGQWEAIELGLVNLIPLRVINSSLDLINITISIYTASTDTVGRVMKMQDVILIPIDEWSGEFLNDKLTNTMSPIAFGAEEDGIAPSALDIDSARFLKGMIRALLARGTTLYGIYRAITVAQMILQANATLGQRLWVFTMRKPSTVVDALDWRSEGETTNTLTLFAAQRYLTARGSR